jgi:hypothetical protein
MSEQALILDNSVLSALHVAGWFDAPSIYASDQHILISELVWEHEFSPYHERDSIPEWATVKQADLETLQTQALGQLSRPDWSCIALAEQTSATGTVVTNDQALRGVATRRDVTAEWGTQFIIRTFKQCGISTGDFERGIDVYLDDVLLPPNVEEEVRDTEKPSTE